MLTTRKHLLSLKAAGVFFVAAGVVVFALNELRGPGAFFRPVLPPVECNDLASGFSVETVGELPEQVVSLVSDRGGPTSHSLYAGTRGNAGVYRVAPRSPYVSSPLIPAAGDQPTFGTAAVSTLALADFDRDGKEELIALTAQENPRGKSRAYLLGLRHESPEMTTAQIASSWPHGIAFVKDVFGRPTFLSAYCGYGEIVEFRMFDRKSSAGFQSRGLESRQLGSVTASGEQIASADLLGAGTHVLVARGFRFNHAAIEIYARDRSTPFHRAKPNALGLGWARKWEFRENDRFGNVRFIVGNLRNGVRDLYAWWCVGLADDETEFVHYKLDSTGLVERRAMKLGHGSDYWPTESQIAHVDADGDGIDELYFTTRSGKLWRFDVPPTESPGDPETNRPAAVPTLVGVFPAGPGPIIPSPAREHGVRPLYIGVSNYVVKVTPKRAAVVRPVATDVADAVLGDF